MDNGLNYFFKDKAEQQEFLKRIVPKDIGVSINKSKRVNEIGPHAISGKRIDEYFDKAEADYFKKKNAKAVVEIGFGKDIHNRGSVLGTAHELGHAEHMVGRGSRLGRFVHNKIPSYLEGKPAGMIGALLAGGAVSDDNPALASGLGAAAGLATTMPELLREHTANREGLKLLKKAGVSENIVKSFKKTARPQMLQRFAHKSLPAIGIGMASGWGANRLKKYIKRRQKREEEY